MTEINQLTILCTRIFQGGHRGLTSLLIQLFQHLTDDLTNTLKRLDVLFGDIKLPLQILDTHSQGLQLSLPFSKLKQALFIIIERLIPLGVAGAVHDGRRTRFV